MYDISSRCALTPAYLNPSHRNAQIHLCGMLGAVSIRLSIRASAPSTARACSMQTAANSLQRRAFHSHAATSRVRWASIKNIESSAFKGTGGVYIYDMQQQFQKEPTIVV